MLNNFEDQRIGDRIGRKQIRGVVPQNNGQSPPQGLNLPLDNGQAQMIPRTSSTIINGTTTPGSGQIHIPFRGQLPKNKPTLSPAQKNGNLLGGSQQGQTSFNNRLGGLEGARNRIIGRLKNRR